nr:hypothetical protein [Tanacetum cinerariifolium]
MAESQCNKFSGNKGKVILVQVIRVMLLDPGETMQVDRQGLLNATTVKVKDIWPGNALSLSDQGIQLEPIYPEYIPLEDEHILPAEEQPLPPVVSPTAESPRYVAESDPEEDPEEYEDDETEDGPVDYPMDGGDDGDDDDGNSSGDDANDKDEDEEEDHLAPADSAVVIPTDELVSPPEGMEPIIPPPSIDTATTGARITVRLQAAISFSPEA